MHRSLSECRALPPRTRGEPARSPAPT
jgi:hypothetical protein